MKFKYFCIFWIIVGQVIGMAIGYNKDPSFCGVAQGWMGSVCVMMAIALNGVVIGDLLGLIDD